jgi:hypothetical protein
MGLAGTFAESNFTFTSPKGQDMLDLPAYRNANGTLTISKWKLTEADIERITKSKAVWLHVIGHGHPPVMITSDNPFKEE